MSVIGGKLKLKRHKKQQTFNKKKHEIFVANDVTPAEKAFIDYQTKNKTKRIEEKVSESHRDRVEKYNKKLAELTEHFDIPRVGS